MEGSTHHDTTEDAAVKSQSSVCDEHSRKKAIADCLVREASDNGGMLSVCLRLPSTYGERDDQSISEAMKLLDKRQQKIQIGSKIELCDFLSVGNAARAHMLAI